MSFIGATGFTEYELRFQQIEDAVYIDKNDISKLYILSSNLSNNLYIGDTSITSNIINIKSYLYNGDTSITSNIINIKSYLYNGDTSITSNIIYIKNELQNETQITPTKTAIYRVKDLEDRFSQIANGYNNGNIIDPQTGQIISNTISAAFSAIGASIANIGNVAAIWYFLGQCAIASQVGQTRAETANSKADRLLDIWEDSGNNVYHKKSGNVGIGTAFNSTLNNRLEVNGNINISNGSKYKINGFNLAYSNLDGFLPDSISSNFITHPILNSCNYIKTVPNATQSSLGIIQVGSGLSITPQGVLSANATASVPIATTTSTGIVQIGTGLSITAGGLLSVPIATNGILGGVKPDVDTIIVNPTTGLISLSGNDIFLNGTANRAYGWASSTSLLGRVAVLDAYSTGSLINDVVLRGATRLILQTGITNPALVINSTNQALFRSEVGIGTTIISTGNILDVAGILKIATGSGTERLTITSTGVQVNHTLNISSGVNTGGLLRFGGFADDSSGDLAIIQNREYATNKGELLLFRGDNIEGTTGVDRIRLRAGAIAFDTYSATSTSATTESIRMYIDGNGRVGIGNTAPIAPLTIGNAALANQDGFLVLGKCTTVGTTRQFRIGLNANFDLAMGDYGGNNVAAGWLQALRISYQSPSNSFVIGANGNISILTGMWHNSSDGLARLYYWPSGATIIRGHTGVPIVFKNTNEVNIATISEGGGIDASFYTASSYILSNNRIYARNGGYDTWIYSDSAGMTLNMGNQSTEGAPTYFRMGAYNSATYYESNQSRSHRFWCYSGTFNGTIADWSFNAGGSAFNANNSANWNTFSDHRVKENIVKADLKTCYDNVKNINLYRFNYIDSFRTASQDKNKLGYIAQEVKRHFPKATSRRKERLTDNREIPDLLNIDTEQINISLYGAVKQLIKIVEKQNKRIKTLETLLNIEDNDEVENDAGQEYVKIYDEEECDIDDIEPTEPSTEV